MPAPPSRRDAARAPAARARRRAERVESSRLRILDAAARCFAELGWRRTRFEDVAAGAGVSRPLVYTYFGSKETLLRAVCERALLAWREAVEPAVARAPGAAAALGAMLHETLMHARAHPLLRAILEDDSRGILLGRNPANRRAIDEWRARLAELLARGVEAGDLRADLDVAATADVLRAMQLGLIDRMHRRDGAIDVASEPHVRAAVELLLSGVRARAAGGRRRSR